MHKNALRVLGVVVAALAPLYAVSIALATFAPRGIANTIAPFHMPFHTLTVSGSTACTAGSTITLTANAKYSNGRTPSTVDILWGSSATDVATVTAAANKKTAVVQCVAAGTTKITADWRYQKTDLLAYFTLAVAAAPAPPSPPMASFTVACDPSGSRKCDFNGSASTGARITYAWSCGASPDCTASAPLFSFTYPTAGQKTATLEVTDSLGRKSRATKTFSVVGPPAPDSVPPAGDTTKPALPKAAAVTFGPALRTTTVSAAGDLQQILNAAQPGDSIVLPASSTWTGNWTLPNKPCGAGITITSAVPAPPNGTRVTPASAAGFAKLVSPNNMPALKAASPTCQWKIDGVEITGTLAQTNIQYGLVQLGDGGSAGSGGVQTSLDKVPQNFVLSHLYLHGTPTLNSTRCLEIQSANTVVRDSWLDECHAQGFDSQAIEGWNGPGPYLIENNFLEGAGENVMFGGADPGIFGLRPSDITIRRNHFYKPLGWQGVWTIKNLFELKSALRVLVEENVFENIWPSGQEGMAVVIKSSTGTTTCVTCVEGTTDLTFRYNRITYSAVGFDIHAVDCTGQACDAVVHVNRVRVTGNLFDRVGTPGGRAALFLLTQNIHNLQVDSNTSLHDTTVKTAKGSIITFDYGNTLADNLVFTDNIFTHGAYGVFYSGKIGAAALDSMAGFGGWVYTRNAMIYGGSLAGRYPAGNSYPTSTAGVDTTFITPHIAGVVLPPLPAPSAAGRRGAPPWRRVDVVITPADRRKLAAQPTGGDTTNVHWPPR